MPSSQLGGWEPSGLWNFPWLLLPSEHPQNTLERIGQFFKSVFCSKDHPPKYNPPRIFPWSVWNCASMLILLPSFGYISHSSKNLQLRKAESFQQTTLPYRWFEEVSPLLVCLPLLATWVPISRISVTIFSKVYHGVSCCKNTPFSNRLSGLGQDWYEFRPKGHQFLILNHTQTS
jgi:hypothetical protein